MTTCHDPYKELEEYLAEAQEEIGLAVKELEETSPPVSTEFPTVQSRTAHDVLSDEFLDVILKSFSDAPKYKPSNVCSLARGLSGSRTRLSPRTRQRMWRMHPSMSFPEDARLQMETNYSDNKVASAMRARSNADLQSSNAFSRSYWEDSFRLEKSFQKTVSTKSLSSFKAPLLNEFSSTYFPWTSCNSYCLKSDNNDYETLDSKSQSESDIVFPKTHEQTLLETSQKNMNLETADSTDGRKLQKQLNSTISTPFSNEFFTTSEKYFPDNSENVLNLGTVGKDLSGSSPSIPFSDPPSGDFNLLSLWADNLVLELDRSLSDSLSPSSESSLSQHTYDELDAKRTSRSPESSLNRIKHTYDEMDVESLSRSPESSLNRIKRIYDDLDVKSTSLSPESSLNHNDYTFDDLEVKSTRSPDSGIEHTTCNSPENDRKSLCSAQTDEHFWPRNGCVSPKELHENSTNPFGSRAIESLNVVLSGIPVCDDIKQSLFNTDYRTLTSLPKMSRINPSALDQWNTLPRNGQYTSSRTDETTDVSIDIVANWMNEMRTKSRDAHTQTANVSRSRSSSFTWVTECDLETPESKSDSTRKSSSDDSSFSDSPSSACSSLYLSACSGGSSESFEEVFHSNNSVSASATSSAVSEEMRPPIEPTELNVKSISAPVLMRRRPNALHKSASARMEPPFTQALLSRSHSAKELNELQAIDACSWLRAAGFPQYAQMYEDGEFPLDISLVQKDHTFLHIDSIQALFRRLMILNKCAHVKFAEHVQRKSFNAEESEEEEEEFALSGNWEFERANRRWSRVISAAPKAPGGGRQFLSPDDCSSRDSVYVDSSPDSVRRTRPDISITFRVPTSDVSPENSSDTLSFASEECLAERRSLRRSGSDRVKEGARALIRRIESLKRQKKKKEATTTASPVLPRSPKYNRDKSKGDSTSDAERSPLFGSQRSKSPPARLKREQVVLSAPLVAFSDCFTEVADKSPTQVLAAKTVQLSAAYTELNQEDGDIVTLWPHRRDSGVGSSLTRSVSVNHVPWHCFPTQRRCNWAGDLPRSLSVSALSAPQMLLLRQFSLLRLTTVMEKSRAGWSFTKLMSRHKAPPSFKDKMVFGVPLLVIFHRTGQALPKSIQAAMDYLRTNAADNSGIFRKSGVRSRIQHLKELCELRPECMCYEGQQVYDVADMLKQYFRQLPEALMTKKLSETFISIFQGVPKDMCLEAIQAALLMLPDENREVLHALLDFLYEICKHSESNQMTPTNVGVCFAPSLFHIGVFQQHHSTSSSRGKTSAADGSPDTRELNENRAAYECLAYMIAHYDTLFTVSEEVVCGSRISSACSLQPLTLEDMSLFSCNGLNGWKGFVDCCVQLFLKEAKDKYKGWKSVSQSGPIDLAYKKLSDGHPLKMWKVSAEIEASPAELLNRIMRERHLWDVSYIDSRMISRITQQTEIHQCMFAPPPPNLSSDYVVLRAWRTDLAKGACILIETSLQHPDAHMFPGSIRALNLASRYLIEPSGSGKSRITYISRVDTMGRSPEWYNQAYGKLCVLLLSKLRNSFIVPCQNTKGPETRV